ncbi:MAG: hypothetical protein ACKKMO_01095 [Candidatus Nealsonbacteria bacterium]
MFGLFGSKEKDREMAESIIKIMHDYYNKARNKFPNKKEIFYLSLACVIYSKKHHPKQYKNDSLSYLLLPFGVNVAGPFSFLEPPDSIDALAYYMIHKERLNVVKEYEQEFNKIISKNEITKLAITKLPESQMNELFKSPLIQEEIKNMVHYLMKESVELEGITEKDF